MKLTKQFANKVVVIDSSVNELPADEFVQGDVLILFNDTDEFVCIESKVPNSYISGRTQKRTMISFSPRGLGNILFVTNDTAVFSGELR